MKPKPQETAAKPKENVGKDYLLLTVIAFTTIVMIVGWANLGNVNRALYAFLIVSLSLTYVKRHFDVSQEAESWIDRVSITCMGLAIALFVVTMYYQIFG